MTSKIAIEERQAAVRELTKLDELSYKLETLILKAKARSKKALLLNPETAFKSDDDDRKFTAIVLALTIIFLGASWISVILAALKVMSFLVPTILFVLTFVISQFMDGTFMGVSSEAFSFVNYLAA
jgi:hypothetical protein